MHEIAFLRYDFWDLKDSRIFEDSQRLPNRPVTIPLTIPQEVFFGVREGPTRSGVACTECILLGIPMDLHAFWLGIPMYSSAFIYARDPYGSAFIMLGIPKDLHAFFLGSPMDLHKFC